MSTNSNIEWCDHTFNPWIGCTEVSKACTGGGGCDGCYAKFSTPVRVLRSKGVETWGQSAPRHRTSASNWSMPKRWNAQHQAFFNVHGRRQRVFCASLADVFDKEVPVQWRIDLMKLILDTPNLDWLLLTKRIGNAPDMLEKAFRAVHAQREGWTDNVPSNVWVGATIVNQAEANRDIPKLLAVPAEKRFLSIEPLLGPVNLRLQHSAREDEQQDMDGWCSHITTAAGAGIKWVIVGGESGPKARPMHPDWARSLRDQCQAAGVPLLFKQWGEWVPRGPESLGYPLVDGVPRIRLTDKGENGSYLEAEGDNHVWMQRAGKKASGRLLDGHTHDGFPS